MIIRKKKKTQDQLLSKSSFTSSTNPSNYDSTSNAHTSSEATRNGENEFCFTLEFEGEGEESQPPSQIDEKRPESFDPDDPLALINRESVYQTIDWHVKHNIKFLKVEEAQMDIAKIERTILKECQEEWQPAMNQNNPNPGNSMGFSARLIAQSLKLMKKTPPKEERDIGTLVHRLIVDRYLCISVGSDRLLSLLIDPIQNQVFAIMRDKNGKFAWKVREEEEDQDEEEKEKQQQQLQSAGSLSETKGEEEPKVIFEEYTKRGSILDRKVLKASSQPILQEFQFADATKGNPPASKKADIVKTAKLAIQSNKQQQSATSSSFSASTPSSILLSGGVEDTSVKKKSTLHIETLIEQVIYFIHNSIIKSNKKFLSSKSITSDESNTEQEHPFNRTNTVNSMKEKMNVESIGRNIKRFIREAHFLLPAAESYNILNHSHFNFSQRIVALDQYATSDKVKVGIVYIGQNKLNEQEILQTENGSPSYERFLTQLGQRIHLAHHQGFLGGLNSERDGEFTIYNAFYNCEVIYHVATMMPTRINQDDKCVSKKRHIGNDFVNIVWNDSSSPFNPSIIPSQFTSTYIVIEPLPSAANNTFHLSIVRKSKGCQTTATEACCEFFPWMDHSQVSQDYLAVLVKILSLNATQSLQQTQARQIKALEEKSLRPFQTRSNLITQLCEEVATDNKGIVGDLLKSPTKQNTPQPAVITKKNSILVTGTSISTNTGDIPQLSAGSRM